MVTSQESEQLRGLLDRAAIEQLRCEFNDSLVMRDYDRFAALFAEDGAWRMPHVGVDFVGPAAIRANIPALHASWEFFVQTSHPGTTVIDGDDATGRAFVEGLARKHDGSCRHNLAVYHDHLRRTPEGWRFTERRYELKYFDTSPLGGPPSRSVVADGISSTHRLRASGSNPATTVEAQGSAS